MFGDSLALNRGRRYTLRQSGNLFAIGGPGAPIMQQTTSTDTNLILAAVSGRSFGTKLYKTKGGPWPFYYGIQPTGRYADEPFVRELYYDGANPIILHRVPEPRVRVPDTPQVVRTPTPTPPQTPNRPVITHIPGITDKIP